MSMLGCRRFQRHGWLAAFVAAFLAISSTVEAGRLIRKPEPTQLFATNPEETVCSEAKALGTCDVVCMCEIMVNRQIYLWDKMFPAALDNPKSKSLCQVWRDPSKTEKPIDMKCYEHCVIAEQYVLASHGWDPKVCARADQESKALSADAILKEVEKPRKRL